MPTWLKANKTDEKNKNKTSWKPKANQNTDLKKKNLAGIWSYSQKMS
jgi:hypothetical protein